MDQTTQNVLDIFADIDSIPRCSKHEERISHWLQLWAKDHEFSYKEDESGNLVIQVPATPGHENGPVLVLQGHMDMVCEKSPDSQHDFTRDPIKPTVDGEWLRANGTTLGADNGIALALALALADDPGIEHPRLELLFTTDEETGLTGANNLKPGFIEGRILLNMDSEEEGVFTVGCAGGRGAEIKLALSLEALPAGFQGYQISISGLRGGHSGVDIHKHRASANKLLARALHAGCKVTSIRLVEMKGGSAHNAIARDAQAVIACDPQQVSALQKAIENLEARLKKEYETSEKDFSVKLASTDLNGTNLALSEVDTTRAINMLLALPQGVVEMSASIEGFVETSSNLAVVELKGDALSIKTSQRSTVMSRLDEVVARIEAVGALAGAEVKTRPGYPAWQPDMDSALLERCKEIYREVTGKDPAVKMIHAGLECGIIGAKYPGMEMISMGATIENPHSPSEGLYIPSIKQVWDFLERLLRSY